MLWERVPLADVGRPPSRSSLARTTCRSSCAARARKRSTTRRSSPTVRSWRSTTRCSARCAQVGPGGHVRGEPVGHRRGRRPPLGAGSAQRTHSRRDVRAERCRGTRARAVGRDHRGVRLLLRDAVRRRARRRRSARASSSSKAPSGDPMRHAFGGDAGSAKVMEGKESLSIDMKSPTKAARSCTSSSSAPTCSCSGSGPASSERLGIDYDDAVEDQSEARLRARRGLRRGGSVQSPTGVREHRARARGEPARGTPGSG